MVSFFFSLHIPFEGVGQIRLIKLDWNQVSSAIKLEYIESA
jgi:hypothetical protein